MYIIHYIYTPKYVCVCAFSFPCAFSQNLFFTATALTFLPPPYGPTPSFYIILCILQVVPTLSLSHHVSGGAQSLTDSFLLFYFFFFTLVIHSTIIRGGVTSNFSGPRAQNSLRYNYADIYLSRVV